jgi:glycosyltransferase involved in cell wall biosynthesis
MRIVIDMQGAQSTGSRNRGIGRYAMAIAQGVARNKGSNEIFLALNGAFAESVESIRTEFQNLIPQENIRLWYPVGSSSYIEAANAWNRQSSEILREAFIASLKPDFVLIASLFEGLVDDAVTSIARFAGGIPTAVILYDLIPLIRRKPYLQDPVVQRWYEEKLANLRKAQLQLAISESSRQESIDYLNTTPEQVVTISTAADSQFRPISVTAEAEGDLRQRYALNRQYVMYTGGIDHRKNIEGLISAYAKLPPDLRQKHQLAIVCSIQPIDMRRLKSLAKECELSEDELVMTGFVPEDDLVALYNLCKVFVFPSWHEGFGLPALEAMACGRAVIGSNCSSLPEVIGRPDALFDPHDEQSIAGKLKQVLTDCAYRQELEQHGIEQAKRFSWDKCAKLAIAAMEHYHKSKRSLQPAPSIVGNSPERPRLAYVSPLPPERSGIADYSAELLPELARYYDIEVIVAQDQVTNFWIEQNCQQHSVEWFCANARRYDRVLYHFGNSSYHQHMFALLEQIPGIVVLHDFFLSGVVSYLENLGAKPGMWIESLYASHGYHAVHQRFTSTDMADVVWKYPCNHQVLQNAQGVIVHSEYSCQLAQEWYGKDASQGWRNIPHLRTPVETDSGLTRSARRSLGLHADQFVVCSFGMLGPTKLNHRLLDAWLKSPLATDKRCLLVFVGENEGSEYGTALSKVIARSGCKDRIKITGWADTGLFHAYLHSADVGVQLRTFSRGETSGTVLDCMNYGIATIVNTNGSMADLPDDGVWKLPDDFSDEQLIEALTALHQDEKKRKSLGICAQEFIRTHHAPAMCASRYAEAIEEFHQAAQTSVPALVRDIAALNLPIPNDVQLRQAANAIHRSIEQPVAQPQIFLDISVFIQRDVGTDMQRDVSSILTEWLLNPPAGWRIEPVYAATSETGYHYARQFTLRFLGCPSHVLVDEPISYRVGDHFVGLNLQPQLVDSQHGYYQSMRQAGVKVRFAACEDILRHASAHSFLISTDY